MLGLDNFNDYYPVALKRARQVSSANCTVRRPELVPLTLTVRPKVNKHGATAIPTQTSHQF